MDNYIYTAGFCVIASVGLVSCATETKDESAPPPIVSSTGTTPAAKPKEEQVATTVSFTKDIKPILANKCTICHNKETLPARPNFETGEQALGGTAIVPGHPEKSRMIQVVKESREGNEQAMPPVSHRLTKQEIALLRTWIAEGASWPPGAAGRVVPAFIPKE